jgi:predicted DNA-binding ribbon-helix-helix protein
MAIRQTRRSVSLSSPLYTATKLAAESRGLTIAHFVAEAIRCAGVEAPESGHFTPATAKRAQERKVVSIQIKPVMP